MKRGLETCADCKDYPCSRFDAEKNGYDSFVTHKKVFANLDMIKTKGLDYFLNQQRIRINILTDFLDKCDDGRSKSFYCNSCALLPIDKLQDSHKFMESMTDTIPAKDKSKRIKDYIEVLANELQIDLKLNNKKNT